MRKGGPESVSFFSIYMKKSKYYKKKVSSEECHCGSVALNRMPCQSASTLYDELPDAEGQQQ